VFCDNRPAHIFKLDMADGGKYCVVSANSDKVSAREPKFLKPNGTLLWLERDLGIDHIFPGSHANCVRLMKKSSNAEPAQVLIDVVKKFEPETDSFAGIYPFTSTWPQHQVALGDSHIAINSVVGPKPICVVVNINTGKYTVVGAQKIVHDVKEIAPNVFVLAGETHDSLNQPQIFITTVKIGKEDVEVTGKEILPYGSASKINALLPGDAGDFEIRHWTHSPRDGSPIKFGSFYVGPKGSPKNSKAPKPDNLPLIILLHGGPHSVKLDTFMAEVIYFLSLGYAFLTVNYRGSLGYGQNSVQSLLGNIGTNDVADCVQGIEECLKNMPQVNKNELFLFGGSHGGFLVTHLAGQYPDMFKAVVTRNPVVHTPSMATTSDIPDWVFNETGANYAPEAYPQPDLLSRMFKSSPSAHIQNIKTPIYFMVGSEDLRVPDHQGISMYRALKAAGKDVRLNVYQDCHSLAKVPVHTNVMVNLAIFFSQNRS